VAAVVGAFYHRTHHRNGSPASTRNSEHLMRTLQTQDARRIEALIGEMTLTEKLGQLTMMAASHTVTGPVITGHSLSDIRTGRIGNLLNLIGAAAAREMQRIAVEESRLGIPLLIGLDVIHGHRTLFPVPLAETALFDPE